MHKINYIRQFYFKENKDHRDHPDDRDNQDMMEQPDNQDHQVCPALMDNLEWMVSLVHLARKDHLEELVNGVYARSTVLSMVVYSSKMVPGAKKRKQLNHFLISYCLITTAITLVILIPQRFDITQNFSYHTYLHVIKAGF